MGVYIKGIGSVSPQRTADNSILSEGVKPFSGNRMACAEPDYAAFFDAKQIRRMSRIIKMGVSSSVIAMKDAGLEKTDGVIVGTALGCLEDTEAFLKKMVQNKEDMLSPTSFIYSTHNTIAAQIALNFQCAGYNSTYVHRNVSFESALMDASMLLNEGALTNVLVGGIDELTDSEFKILERLGHFKKAEALQDGDLYGHASKGSVAGEGASCFVLTNQANGHCYAELKTVQTFSFATAAEVSEKAAQLVKAHGADLLIAGHNGDHNDDHIFDQVSNDLELETIRYKHLCGEYATASAFALWIGCSLMKNGTIPGVYEKKGPLNNILLYNQYKNLHHTLILISKC